MALLPLAMMHKVKIMRTDEQTAQMRSYFVVDKAEYPKLSNIIRISAGLILFGIFIMLSFNNTTLAGTALILLGIGLFLFWIKPYFRDLRAFKERPSEEQINNWLIEDLNEVIKKTAIDKLKLSTGTLELKNFLIVPYPVYWQVPGLDEENILKRTTETGATAYSVWNVQVVALTKNYISYYTCSYDWLNNSIVNERTNEFFYDDISSVKNDMEIIERKFVDKEYVDDDGNATAADKLTATVFKVTNMSTDSLDVITNIAEMGHSPNLIVNLEKAVQALRIILRKRRYDEEQDPIIVEPPEEEEIDQKEEDDGNADDVPIN